MEKFNNNEELETLMLRLNAYRTFLTSLKSGTSMNDYLNIRDEFYSLKTRISEIVYVDETNKEGHSSDIQAYKKQIQHFKPQFTSLDQTVEEFLDVLNQIIEETANKTTLKEPPSFNTAEETRENIGELHSTGKEGLNLLQPTYHQLKNLADRKSQLKPVAEKLAHKIEDNNIVTHPSHFNADYFQAINSYKTNRTHHISRHVSTKKMAGAPTADHLKNQDERDNVDIQKSVNEFSSPIPSIDDSDTSSNSITNQGEHLPATIQESQSINEQTIEQLHQSIAPLMEKEASAMETKKPKSSLFFNLFRK